MKSFGRLLRLSLAPSAVADVLAGLVVACGDWPAGEAPFALMLAALSVYHGGMVLNDWADREHDARTRPERPIPSGAIAAPVALSLALVLFVAGPALALVAGPRPALLVALVAGLAALYDLAGRGPWSGPLLLAACRGGNLGVGLVYGAQAAGVELQPALAAPALLYGLYVFVVSRLGRLEDSEERLDDESRPRRLLLAAAGVLAAIGLLAALGGSPAPTPAPLHQLQRPAALVVALLAARGLVREARADGPWPAGRIMGAMGLCLRRLLVCTAALALGAGSWAGLVAGLVILAGYPLSHALRRVFPPS